MCHPVGARGQSLTRWVGLMALRKSWWSRKKNHFAVEVSSACWKRSWPAARRVNWRERDPGNWHPAWRCLTGPPAGHRRWRGPIAASTQSWNAKALRPVPSCSQDVRPPPANHDSADLQHERRMNHFSGRMCECQPRFGSRKGRNTQKSPLPRPSRQLESKCRLP